MQATTESPGCSSSKIFSISLDQLPEQEPNCEPPMQQDISYCRTASSFSGTDITSVSAASSFSCTDITSVSADEPDRRQESEDGDCGEKATNFEDAQSTVPSPRVNDPKLRPSSDDGAQKSWPSRFLAWLKNLGSACISFPTAVLDKVRGVFGYPPRPRSPPAAVGEHGSVCEIV